MAQPSGLGQWNSRSFLRGLVIAVATAVLTVVKTSIDAGGLKFDWPAIIGVALTSAIGYLLMNLGTNNVGELLKKDA